MLILQLRQFLHCLLPNLQANLRGLQIQKREQPLAPLAFFIRFILLKPPSLPSCVYNAIKEGLCRWVVLARWLRSILQIFSRQGAEVYCKLNECRLYEASGVPTWGVPLQ